jgi:hypothetical protein
MTTNINPNFNPTTEPTNPLFNTQIPTLTEDANIQEALRIYHYGNASSQPSNNSAIEPNTMAGHLKALRDDVSDLQDLGIGSQFSTAEPTDPEDGFVWLKADSSASQLLGTVAIYQNEEPTGNLVDGQLWVDKNSSPLKMYVYDIADEEWKEIGA